MLCSLSASNVTAAEKNLGLAFNQVRQTAVIHEIALQCHYDVPVFKVLGRGEEIIEVLNLKKFSPAGVLQFYYRDCITEPLAQGILRACHGPDIISNQTEVNGRRLLKPRRIFNSVTASRAAQKYQSFKRKRTTGGRCSTTLVPIYTRKENGRFLSNCKIHHTYYTLSVQYRVD